MANHNPFEKIKRRGVTELEDTFNNITGQEEQVRLISIDKLMPGDNPYPISELEDLITSIKQYGLEQSLVVKKVGNNYTIISGHRRYYAIKQILQEQDDAYEELEQVYCKVASDEENEIITRLRLHESNLQARPLLKMEHDQKIAIIEDYLNLIKTAREQKILINGEFVKGKSREIISKAFNISLGTAQSLIKEINVKNSDNEGGQNCPLTENVKKNKNVKQLEQILDKLQKTDYIKLIDDKYDYADEIKKLLFKIEGELSSIVSQIN